MLNKICSKECEAETLALVALHRYVKVIRHAAVLHTSAASVQPVIGADWLQLADVWASRAALLCTPLHTYNDAVLKIHTEKNSYIEWKKPSFNETGVLHLKLWRKYVAGTASHLLVDYQILSVTPGAGNRKKGKSDWCRVWKQQASLFYDCIHSVMVLSHWVVWSTSTSDLV